MEKRASSIIIYARGNNYFADATRQFGGGYLGAYTGSSPEEAALFALREEERFIRTNPLGGTLIAPPEVQEIIKRLKAEGRTAAKTCEKAHGQEVWNILVGGSREVPKPPKPIPQEKMTRLFDLDDRVRYTLENIRMMYEDIGQFTKKDAALHFPGLIEAGNLVYFLQDEARKALLSL